MKHLIYAAGILLILAGNAAQAQDMLRGQVRNALDGKPVAGASVRLKQSRIATRTDADGRFALRMPQGSDTLSTSHIGFAPFQLPVNPPVNEPLQIELHGKESQLNEVQVSTGYSTLPRERATGSFATLDSALFNRSVTTDVLSRLEDVTNGMSFDRSGRTTEATRTPALRVRGVSTIGSDNSPLIVVDNFPYDGAIENLNPNDVESITVLKDAAAASIWGARAGNGVIVITTKKGRAGRPVLSLNSNVTFMERPDLYYERKFLTAPERMAIEQELFDNGFFTEVAHTPLSPHVEMLIARRDDLVSEEELQAQLAEWRQIDVREEALRSFYRTGLNQQHALNIRGGGEGYRYYHSAGFDRDLTSNIGDGFSRFTANSNNNVKLSERLGLELNFFASRLQERSNGMNMDGTVSPRIGLPPYTRFQDEAGNPLEVVRNLRLPYIREGEAVGLLDWAFRPLEERDSRDVRVESGELRLKANLNYKMGKGLSLRGLYQFQYIENRRTNLQRADSWFVRDMVNRFTQADGSRPIPHGDIYEGSNDWTTGHFGRLQADYDRRFGSVHRVNALAGAELRSNVRRTFPGFRLFNYSENIVVGETLFDYTRFYPQRPDGVARIQLPPTNTMFFTDRFISYFANGSYEYDGRYTLTGSARWDASNLFGVNTNQRGVPLWSVGGSWNLSEEGFFEKGLVDYLRLRATYGHNGNLNRVVSAVPTARYNINGTTGLRQAVLTSTGNPSLRWETVKTWNLGADFRLKKGWLEGSVEYYQKAGFDLIGNDFLDPTTGISEQNRRFEIDNRVNYANLLTRGVDVELRTHVGSQKFAWDTNILFNFVDNRITNYFTNDAALIATFFPPNTPAPPREGVSRDVLYALPWYGLDHETGMPLVMHNGELNMNYSGYMNSVEQDDLLVMGVTVPRYTAALRNTFTYGRLTLSFNLVFKGGHHFRRESVNYQTLLTGTGHVDFRERWQQPGDERFTNVPAMPGSTVLQREQVYRFGEHLIERGEHIRFRDLNLSFRIDRSMLKGLPVESINFYTYLNNLGILWRANDFGLDPDMPLAPYPLQRSYAFGMQVQF